MKCLYDLKEECPIGDNENGEYCWACNKEFERLRNYKEVEEKE